MAYSARVAPEQRIVPRFAAEPPQERLPYGRWAERLEQEFLAACGEVDAPEGEVGAPGPIAWYPDRTWHGHTYVPATTITSEGNELFGYVRFAPSRDGGEPQGFAAWADYTEETAERNPDWRVDICDEVIGSWRGENSAVAAITLIWGRPLVSGGRLASAELGELAVDQCALVDERFTLIAPDDYRGDLLEVVLWGKRGQELARESLYEDDEDEDEDDGQSTVGEPRA